MQMVCDRPLQRLTLSATRRGAGLTAFRQQSVGLRCTSTGQQHALCRRQRRLHAAASSAAASAWAAPAGFLNPDSSEDDYGELAAPPALPPTPKSSSLLDVFPYLARLALSERSLYWRLALALVLMVASKVAGAAQHSSSICAKNALVKHAQRSEVPADACAPCQAES